MCKVQHHSLDLFEEQREVLKNREKIRCNREKGLFSGKPGGGGGGVEMHLSQNTGQTIERALFLWI